MNAEEQTKRALLRKWLKITAVAVCWAVLALIVATFLFARQAGLAKQDTDRRARLNSLRTQLQGILLAVTDAETGQRGYLLTGKERYLKPYRDAVQQLPPTLVALDALSASEPTLAAHLGDIRRDTNLKLAELDETLRLYDDGRRAAALQLVQTDEGQRHMELLRAHVGAVSAAISADLSATSSRAQQRFVEAERLGLIAVSVLVVCVLLAGIQIAALMVAQRRYEYALRLSERRHRGIVEEQTEYIALSRASGELAYINPAYAVAFGLSAERLGERSLYDAVLPSDRDDMRRQLETLLESGQAISTEGRMTTAAGEQQWISWRHRLQTAPDGERLVHSVGRDVTVRRNAEEALRASEDFLERTGRLAGVGGWELDVRTQQLRWSRQVKRLHEVPDSYVPQLDTAMEFYPVEVRETVSAAIEAGKRQHQEWEFEAPLSTAGGRRIYVHVTGQAEYDDDGNAVRLLGAIQDISARKSLEQRLEASERFVRTVTDNVPVRMAYIDHERRYRFLNRSLCQRLGGTREALLGRPVSEVLDAVRDAATLAAIEAAFSGMPRRFERDDDVRGTAGCIEMHAIPDFGPDADVRGVFVIGVDITHLKTVERALRDLTDVFENTPDFIGQVDRRGQLQYLNPAARRALGLEPSQPLLGRSASEFFTTESNARFATEIIPTAKRDGTWVGESALRCEDGRVVPVEHMVIAHHDANGQVARYSSIKRDISKEVSAREELARQTATLNAIIESMPAMVAVWDTDLRFRLVNNAFERWRGKRREDVAGQTFAKVMGAEETELSLPWIRRVLAGETVSFEKDFNGPLAIRHATVTYIPMRLLDGSVGGFVGVAQDITQHRDEHLRLRRLSELDPLTGLLNRNGLEEYLEDKTEHGAGASLAVLYIDLDYFKVINDTYGHAMGDEVLREFAERLKAVVRPTDAVARLGGDEFALVLADVREAGDATMVADKIVELARQPVIRDDLMLSIGASVGVAFNADAGGWQGLLARADAMVYRAKAAGRGRSFQAPAADEPGLKKVG